MWELNKKSKQREAMTFYTTHPSPHIILTINHLLSVCCLVTIACQLTHVLTTLGHLVWKIKNSKRREAMTL